MNTNQSTRKMANAILASKWPLFREMTNSTWEGSGHLNRTPASLYDRQKVARETLAKLLHGTIEQHWPEIEDPWDGLLSLSYRQIDWLHVADICLGRWVAGYIPAIERLYQDSLGW
jgi:hypothetical protein